MFQHWHAQCKTCLFILIGLLLAGSAASAEDDIIPFNSERWDLGPGSRVVEHLGRSALTGGAELKDVIFRNGVVEVDIAFSSGRNFPGISFRKQDAANFEEFYVRPHKSGQPDALQYTPVFNGLSAWQLYHGEGFTAARTIPTGKWVSIRMEISGTRGQVFFGEGKRPALVIPDLKHGETEGGLALKVTGAPGLAHFSNFRFFPDDNLKIDAPAAAPSPTGMLTEWELSRPFKFNAIDKKRYPDADTLSGMDWRTIRSEPSGLVNISRWAVKGPVVPDSILARTIIQAQEAGSMDLQFGYSDQVSLFLNGELLFFGTSIFRQRDPFFQGLVGLFDAVRLPLKPGGNELLLIVSESMGGWGFMCRNLDAVEMAEGVQPAWELAYRLSYPETVLYDRPRDVLYVTNLYSDGRQHLSRLSPDGKILDREWVTGLNRPTGLAAAGDTLYVVERAGLAEIDIPTAAVVNRYPFPSPGFPNDVAVDESGRMYVSDGQKRCVYRFEDGAWSSWLKGPELAQVNGLHFEAGRLYLGCGSDFTLKWVDTGSAELRLTTLTSLDRGAIVDGIESGENGSLLVSDFNGKVYRVSPDGAKTRLLDLTATGKTCANFAYIPEKKLLVIPTLTDNRILAYRIDDR